MKIKRIVIPSLFAILMLTLFLFFDGTRKTRKTFSLEVKPAGHPLK